MNDIEGKRRYFVAVYYADDFESQVGLNLGYRDWEDGKLYRMQPGEYKELDINKAVEQEAKPMMVVPVETVRKLMDELWGLGIRPSQNKDISEVMKAKDANLADLRHINEQLLGLLK